MDFQKKPEVIVVNTKSVDHEFGNEEDFEDAEFDEFDEDDEDSEAAADLGGEDDDF